MCFAVSLVSFVAAGVGLLINYLLAEAMAIAGMLAVSLFFLAMGLLNRNEGAARGSVYEDDSTRAEAIEPFEEVLQDRMKSRFGYGEQEPVDVHGR